MPARLALVCAALLAGCAPAPGASSHSDEALELTPADAGKPITLAVGQRAALFLPSNPTTGYSWALADSAGGALARDGASVYQQNPSPPGEPPMAGRGGTETWTFRGARAGTGTLRLVYRRPFEPDGPPAETFSAPVTVR